jgi:hypothetical protein
LTGVGEPADEVFPIDVRPGVILFRNLKHGIRIIDKYSGYAYGKWPKPFERFYV